MNLHDWVSIAGAESGDEYAHVRLALEPLENGEGFEFSDQIAVDAAVPETFLSHIEIGALQAAEWGFEGLRWRISTSESSMAAITMLIPPMLHWAANCSTGSKTRGLRSRIGTTRSI